MKKGFWIFLVIIFGLYLIEKITVPSFESYREKAKISAGKTENQQATANSASPKAGTPPLTAPAPVYNPV